MDSIYFKGPWYFIEKKKWDKTTPYCQFQDCGRNRLHDKEYRCLSCGLTLCHDCHQKVTFGSAMLKKECGVFCLRCAKYVKEVSKREKEKASHFGLQPGVCTETNTNALHSDPITKVNVSHDFSGKLFYNAIKNCFGKTFEPSFKKKSYFSVPDPLPVSCGNTITTRETMEPCIAPKENPPPNSVTKTWKGRFSSSTQNSSTSTNKKKPEGSCIEDRNAETAYAEHHTRDMPLKERKKIYESDSESMFPLSDGFVSTASLSTSTSPFSGLPNIPRLPLSPPPPAVSTVEPNISCASSVPPLSQGGDVALLKGGENGSISTPSKEMREQKRALNQKPILSSESKYVRNHADTVPLLSSSYHQLSLNTESQQSCGFDLTNHTVSGRNKAAATSTSTYDSRTAKSNVPALPIHSSSTPCPLPTTIPGRTSTALKGGVETNPEHHFTDEDESFVDEKEYLLQWSDQLAQKEKSISEFLAVLLEKAQKRENYIHFLEEKLSEAINLHLSYVNEHLRRVEREEEEQREMLLEEEYQ